MKYKKLLTHGFALLLCVTFIMSIFQFQGVSAIFDPIIPIEDDGADWEEKTAIYWNPKSNISTNSNSSRPSDIATDSNIIISDQATKSNVITIMATNSNSRLASGSNVANGLTPDSAVENLNIAIRQAEKLSSKLSIEMSDIIIYAMNPMYILPETSYVINGKGVTIVPWAERAYDEEYIFVVEGGQLTLDNIKIRPYNVATSPEKSLVYMSSGVIQLGEQVESWGTFVLDYNQPMSTQNPVIELKNNFDFAMNYRLDLRFPKGVEQEIPVINSLSPDKIPVDVFKNAFPVVDIEDEWEIFVVEQSPGVRRNTVNEHIELSNSSELTQKSLVARQDANVYEKILDPSKHVLTVSKTVVGTQEDKEKYFQFMIGLPGKIKAYVLDSNNKVVTSEKNYPDGKLYKDKDGEYIQFSFWNKVRIKDGQKLVFTDIPLNTRYSAVECTVDEEIDYTRYKASVKVVANGQTLLEMTQKNTEDLQIEPQTIVKNGNIVAFTNTNRSLVTVTVSKQVEGYYADRTKTFLFKIYLRDSKGTALADGTQLSYKGGVIADSGAIVQDGILTLDQEGSTTLGLMHGQQIEITGVPPGQVRIHETEEKPEYSTSYRDGNSALIAGSDTGWVEMVTNKTFDFTNYRIDVVPSGILTGQNSGIYLFILSMLMLVGMISVAHVYNSWKRK